LSAGRRTLARSRWVLAASLLALVTGSLWLSDRVPGAGAAGNTPGVKLDAAGRERVSNQKGIRSLPRLKKTKPAAEVQGELPR
jgi:hypothetical protein